MTLVSLALLVATNLPAQTPAPKPSPSPTPSPVVTPTPTPTTAALINSMDSAEVQQAIGALKSNFIHPAELNQLGLERATFEGLMARLGRGVMLLPAGKQPGAAAASGAFYSEILDNHIGYLRLGQLSTANLQAMDEALRNFAGKKVDALVIDLRASSPTTDFATAAEFMKRFAQKGKPLFTLRKASAKQDHVFVSDRDPAYNGLIIVLADADTAGASEAFAYILRHYNKAMIIGQPTAGRAVEYSEVQLSGGKILRIAVAEMILPDGRTLFPNGAMPDVPVEMNAAEKEQIFELSRKSGMATFVFEKERPHFNEAALLAGTNPEIEPMSATGERSSAPSAQKHLRDPVVQRAVDLVTSLAVYQKR